MSTLSHKLVAVCLVAAFSMVMYGCGGGGGSSSVPDAPEMMPEEPTGPTADEMAAADAAMTAANEAATAANEAATAANDAVSNATLVTDTMAASDAATAATAAAMVATAAAAAVDAAVPATVTAANDAATAANMAAMTANTAASDLNTAEAAAVAAAEEAARIAAETAARVEAMRIAGMIDPNATLADYDGTGGEADQIVSIDATTRMPVFQGDPASEESTDPRFTESGDAPASIAGWAGATYTRTTETGGVTNVDTVVKYNDKAPNTDASFSDYFGTNAASRDGVEGDTDGVLTLSTDQTGNHGLFSISFGLDARGQTLDITHDDLDTPTTETSTSYKGTFTGVPGTFTCTTTCSVSSDQMDGNLITLTGEWTFKPDGLLDNIGGDLTGDALAAALMRVMVPGVVPDPDFMILGYWMRMSTAADGEVTHSMLPIHDGLRDFGDVPNTVLGTATYSGPATGLYMKKSLTPDGQPTDPFTSGQFTADALLTARFSGGEVASNHAFSIDGTISDFKDGGYEINDQWVVNLNRRMIGDDNDEPQRNIGAADAASHGTGTGGTFDDVTDGGPLGSAAGSWSGMFHGDSGTENDVQPASASGMFDGHFSNGHVRGAFAANRQAE